MGVSRGRSDRIEIKTGHVADDPQCVYWAGDFAGVRLDARCLACRANEPEEVLQWLHPDVTGKTSPPTTMVWSTRAAVGIICVNLGVILIVSLVLTAVSR